MQNSGITRKRTHLSALLQRGAWIWLALAGLSAGGLQAQVPTITAFNPSSGSCGTAVVITGTGFSGVTGVKFGGANAAYFTVNSSTQITATVGASASGSVTVQNGSGTGSLAGFTHLDATAPTLTCPTAVTINTSPGLCTGATSLVAPLAPDNCDVISNGLNFDGSNDYVAFNGFSITTNTLTIECWIKPNGPQSSADGLVYRRGGAVATGLAIGYLDPTRIGYNWNDQANTYNWTSGPVYNQNVWNHVALVIEPNKATIYLNGVGYVNAVSHGAINLSGLFRLGQDDLQARLFNGVMDEVRVWNYARTQAQIQANMQLELNAQPGLLRVYHLNEGVPTAINTGITTAADASGNNASGTLNNFALSGAASNWVVGTVTIPNAVLTNNAPSILPIGNTSVVWTATDAMGNSSTCAQTVTVVDNEAPVVTCPANQVLNAGTNCSATATYAATATDNCGSPSVTYSPVSGSAFALGTATVTATATDGFGNSAACTFTVTVNDVTPPTMTCPTALTINTSPGLCTGATTLVAPLAPDNCGGLGNGLKFDGADDYVGFNGFNITSNTLTIECWIKPNGPQGANDGIVYRRSGAVATGLAIGDSDPTRIGYTWNNQTNSFSWTGGPVYNVNVWNHVALVIEPSQATIYLNGVGYVNPVSHPAINLSGVYRLGQDDFASRLFNGAIDEVRIWNYARTQAQIQANMQQELNAQPGLLRVYHLNEGAPTAINTGITTAADASGNNATGTLNNFALSGAASNWVAGTVLTPNAAVTGNSPGIFPIGNTNVVWTATDAMGNSSTCAQTVTVVDNEFPAINCPVNQTLSAGPNCDAIATYAATASDNCGLPTLSYTPASGSIFNLGVASVIARATDAAGNVSSCTFTVMVNDVTPPTVTCQATQVSPTTGSPAMVTPAMVTLSATDNCGAVTSTVTPNSFTCAQAGQTITVDLAVTDANGNTSHCSPDVEVLGTGCNQAPVAVCQNLTVNADGNCQGTPDAADFNNGSSDPNGDALTYGVAPAGPYALGNTSVVLTVSDGSLSSTCSASIQVNDVTPPTITCPGDISVSNGVSACSAVVNYTAPVGTDNCSGASTLQTAGLASGAAFPVGVTTNTFEVTAGGGGSACSFTVTVNDTESPSALCQDLTVALDANGLASITPSQANSGSTDNCGIATTTLSNTQFGCNTASYALNFDGINDYVLMPSDIVNGLADFTFEAWVNYTDNGYWTRIMDIGIDETFNMFLTPKANRFPNVGQPRLAITVGGNSAEELIDANIPMPTGWHHIAVTLDQIAPGDVQGKMYIDGVVVGSNNAMTLTPASLGVTTQNLLGKSQYNDPYFNGAMDEVRIWSVARTQAQIQSSMSNALSGSEFGLFVYYDFEDGPGSPIANDGSPSNNDGTLTNMNNTTAFITPGVINTIGIGSQSVTLTVTDNSGNSATCVSNVTVADNLAPSLSCSNYTIALNGSSATIFQTDVVAAYADNCEVQSISLSSSTFGCSNVGANTVIVTATDVSSNSATCSATVTVSDVTPPTITCPADITAAAGPGCVSTAVVTYSATMTDNCAGGSVTFSLASGSTFNGTTTVTATATDASSNSAACTFTVTVTVPALLTVAPSNTGNVCVNANTASVLANASGGTPSYTYLWSPSNLTTSSLTGVGAGTHSVTVTDARGCTATGSTTVGTFPVIPSTFNVSQ